MNENFYKSARNPTLNLDHSPNRGVIDQLIPVAEVSISKGQFAAVSENHSKSPDHNPKSFNMLRIVV
jgi:hypothetical protein